MQFVVTITRPLLIGTGEVEVEAVGGLGTGSSTGDTIGVKVPQGVPDRATGGRRGKKDRRSQETR